MIRTPILSYFIMYKYDTGSRYQQSAESSVTGDDLQKYFLKYVA